MIKRRNIMSWDGGSGYKTYIFEEFIRRCAIDCKGRGRKEVIYLRVTDVSCTRVYARVRGSPIEAPAVGFCDRVPFNIIKRLPIIYRG